MLDRRWVLALAGALVAASPLVAQTDAPNPERTERQMGARHPAYAHHPRQDWRLARRGARLERDGMRMERRGHRLERRGERLERHGFQHRGRTWERKGERLQHRSHRLERRGAAFERHALRHHRLRAARRHHQRLDGRI